MGHQGNTAHPAVAGAIQDALSRISASDKAAGILALDHDTALIYRDWGAQFLAVGIDVVMLAQTTRATMDRWRAAE